jgi:hypothetical protein
MRPKPSRGLVADLRGRGESYLDYYPSHVALVGAYPDDRPDIERRLQSRINEILKSQTKDPPHRVPLEDLVKRLEPGHHPAEEVRRTMELMRHELDRRRPAEIERYQKQQPAALERAQRDLAAFREHHANDDVLEAVLDHLSRLGWRTETEQDRERIHQEWVERAVQVLQEVHELEQRPAVPAPTEPLRGRGAINRWR